MTDAPSSPSPSSASARGAVAPTLAEDLLLLLFQPNSGLRRGAGTIAGENTLYYTLAGAVLTELGLDGSVSAEPGPLGTVRLRAVEERPPADDVLRPAWEYVRDRPRDVQTVLAAIGPELRTPVLERVIARGDIRRSTRRTLGLFNSTVLEDGGTGRRAGLLAAVRAVLVDGREPTPREGALAALLSGSGTLPQFDPAIPWSSPVITRAKELERGEWGPAAAADAVERTALAILSATVATTLTVVLKQE